jgi:hypothetical protein
MAIGGVVPEVGVQEGTAPGLEVPIAPEITEETREDALSELRMDVVVRSPEIQDAEAIRSAPMSEAATTSRDGLELLASNLIDPVMVARNLESMRRAEQWMKVRCDTLSSRIPQGMEYSMLIVVLCRMSSRDLDKNLTCSRGMVTQCSVRRRWTKN